MPVQRGKLLDRKVNVRDARLFVIATEGSETEGQYFQGFNSPRIKVEILPTGEDGHSAPEQVLERLNDFRKRFQLGSGDELWLVIDVDRWGQVKLRDVCRKARNRFQTAVSNPCFEFWLLLHLQENDIPNDDWAALVAKNHGNPSKAMEEYLRQRLAEKGGYQKSNLQPERFYDAIPTAVERAKRCHTDSDEPWPRQLPGTHVYLLAERLLSAFTIADTKQMAPEL